MTWRAVRWWAEACIGRPAGVTRLGTLGRKQSLMLANEAPDSVRVAECTNEYQAQVKFIAPVVDKSFGDSHMKVGDEESISCNWLQMTWQRALVEQCDICGVTDKRRCTYVGIR